MKRKEFAEILHDLMGKNQPICLLTADLGYGLWDKIKIDYPDRFINTGSCEQLAIGMACGMALSNKIPVVYSITPFLLYRPFELIRNFLDKDKIPITLVGGGRDKDYGKLGYSHWAHDDLDILSTFHNIKKYKKENLDAESIKKIILDFPRRPTYINLEK